MTNFVSIDHHYSGATSRARQIGLLSNSDAKRQIASTTIPEVLPREITRSEEPNRSLNFRTLLLGRTYPSIPEISPCAKSVSEGRSSTFNEEGNGDDMWIGGELVGGGLSRSVCTRSARFSVEGK
jgi:hypothetical protein